MINNTLYEYEVVDGLLQAELLYEEGLLLLGRFLEEILEVAVPDL